MAVHKPALVTLVVVTFLLTIIGLTLMFLASFETPLNKILPELFIERSRGPVERIKTDLETNPWMYYTRIVIFAYQIIWLVYGLSTLCRKSNDWQGYLYYHPRYMPAGLYVSFSLNALLGTAFVFVWDRGFYVPASGILFGMSLTVYICLGISYRALNKQGPALIQKGHMREIRLVRGLVQNGLAMYASWITVSSLLNLSSVMSNEAGFKQEDVSTVILGGLSVILILIFFVDITVLDKWSRYTMTHYMIFVLFYAAILDGNDSMNRNFIITAVLLGLAAFALLFKIGFVIVKCRREPEPILRDIVA